MTVLKVSGKMTPSLDFCRRRRAGVDFCAKVDWRRRIRRVRWKSLVSTWRAVVIFRRGSGGRRDVVAVLYSRRRSFISLHLN